MSEVVVVASLTAEPGKEAEAEEALRGIVEPSHAEAGCRLYSLHRGLDDQRRFAVVERWASREDLETHFEEPHMKAALGRIGELFGQNVDITFYEAMPTGEEAKGSLAGAAALRD